MTDARFPKFLQEDIELCKEIENPNGEATAYGHLGKTYNRLNNFNIALEFFKKSIKIFQKLNNHYRECEFMQDLSYSFFRLEKYLSCLVLIKKSQQLAYQLDIEEFRNSCNTLLEEYEKKISNKKFLLFIKEIDNNFDRCLKQALS